tara:strand:- start:92 stop:421 length:330 start_codon:yes stop_codon:yes gene_type:complete
MGYNVGDFVSVLETRWDDATLGVVVKKQKKSFEYCRTYWFCDNYDYVVSTVLHNGEYVFYECSEIELCELSFVEKLSVLGSFNTDWYVYNKLLFVEILVLGIPTVHRLK